MISPENLTRVRKCKTSFLADIWNLQSKSSPEILISPLSRAPEPCAVLKLRRWQKTENLALLHHQLAHSEVERQWPERNERDERVPKQGKEKNDECNDLSPPTAPFLKALNWSCHAGIRRIRLSQTRPTQLRFPPPLCNGLPDLMNLLSPFNDV